MTRYREDATKPGLSSLERLALVRERVVRIAAIRRELEAAELEARNLWANPTSEPPGAFRRRLRLGQ